MLPIDPATPTAAVARALLGAVLHRVLPDGERLAGRIVETEAYLGLEDPACHSFHGRRTARVAAMYLAAGHAYVYRIYGLHWCLNVVTGDAARPEAVLIRALAPLAGGGRRRAPRAAARPPGSGRAAAARRVDLAGGPARLTQALAIDGRLDGHPLDRPPLWLEAGARVPDERVIVGPRGGRWRGGAWPACRQRFRAGPGRARGRAPRAAGAIRP